MGNKQVNGNDEEKVKDIKPQAKVANISNSQQKGTLKLRTEFGDICLELLLDHAPETCKYITSAVGNGFYDKSTFYRSDFVIQCGLHNSGVKPPGNILVNETDIHKQMSNTRGTASIAHWDVPDCGNTEFFINLKTNDHLDTAYGGYCVFAVVNHDDQNSFAVIDKIAAEIASKRKERVKMTAEIV